MRKPVLAVLVAGSAFALTAAAAGAITVTGPFNPRAGTGAVQECDPGATTLTTQQNANAAISGFDIAPTNDMRTSAQPNCADKYLWVKITYTDTSAGSVVKNAYFRSLATAFDGLPDHYTPSMSLFYPTAADAAAGTNHLGNLDPETNDITNSQVLVSSKDSFTRGTP